MGAHLQWSVGSIKRMRYLEKKKREEGKNKQGTAPEKPLSIPQEAMNRPQANLCALVWAPLGTQNEGNNETSQPVLCFYRELLLRLVRKESINRKSS